MGADGAETTKSDDGIDIEIAESAAEPFLWCLVIKTWEARSVSKSNHRANSLPFTSYLLCSNVISEQIKIEMIQCLGARHHHSITNVCNSHKI